ncbi:MAG: class I SAM-dependent methyltransferase [Helicobacteraceae bacterium]
MKQGDFTQVAKDYHNRPAYSSVLLEKLFLCVNERGAARGDFKVAEVGAGTGKLTKMLCNMGLAVTAVEPNDAMRNEGVEYTKNTKAAWHKASAENTGLQEGTYDWVIMASSFHWTDAPTALAEFRRILAPGGSFTAMWNPRNLQEGTVFYEIEEQIRAMLPDLKRVSSGAQNTKDWTAVIESSGHFKNCFFAEIDYTEHMSRERYIGAWKSVNDIQAQAGSKWGEILSMIESKISGLDIISVPYKIRAWTAQRI